MKRSGFRTLVVTQCKNDALVLAPGVLVIIVLSVSSILAYNLLFPSYDDRVTLAATLGSNPALTLLFGTAKNLLTVDGFNAWRSFTLGTFMSGLCAILFTTKIREDEDTGQAELVASTAISRQTRLCAPILVLVIWTVIGGILCALFTVLCGGGLQTSSLLAATFVVASWLCGAWGALCAQICSDAGQARRLAIGVLAFLVLARGILSVDSIEQRLEGWWFNPTYLNPITWLSATDPAENPHWLVLLAPIILAVIITGIALIIGARRDYGRGIVETHSRTHQKRKIRPATVAWICFWVRINCATLLLWFCAAVFLSCVFGFLVKDSFGADGASSMVSAMMKISGLPSQAADTSAIGTLLLPVFFRTICELIALMLTIPGVQIITRLVSEESAGRVEPLLATPLSRKKAYCTVLLVGCIVSSVLIIIAGGITGMMSDISGGTLLSDARQGALQAGSFLPASWVVCGISAIVVGVRPPIMLPAWIGVVVSFVLMLFGSSFRLPDYVLAINPFYHAPTIGLGDSAASAALSLEQGSWTATIILCVVAVVFSLVGARAYSRRSIPSN